MPEPFGLLWQVLGTPGGVPVWLVGVFGMAMLVWSVLRWSEAATPRLAARMSGFAAVFLAFGLLLWLGVTLGRNGPLMPWWQWVAGLLVLPWLIRTRIGAPAAMLFFLCLSMALAHVVGWTADPRSISGAVLLAGGALQLAAAVAARLAPRPPAPVPVSPEALQARLDMNESADRSTRE